MRKHKETYISTLTIAFLMIPSTLFGSEQTQAFSAKPGPYQVATVSYEWNDTQRQRAVPVKIYYPKTGDGPFPLIIFSHGLGGTRETYKYLGRHWASYGYVSVHVQHKGSDDAVWQDNPHPLEGMRNALVDFDNSKNRPADVSFAIDKMQEINCDPGPLKGRVDLQHIGMAGHSFGAWTTLVIAGQVLRPPGKEMSYADPRIEAAIAMSPPAPANKTQLDKNYAHIKIPCMIMTGTLDNSSIASTTADQRRMAFDHIKAPDQYLIVLNGGDHMVFAGIRALEKEREKDALFHDLICISSTAFWDAYLKHNAPAKIWLSGGGFQKVLGEEGTFEKK
jgi:predicted dienelactone hydrolase